jgi:hypothetical protein
MSDAQRRRLMQLAPAVFLKRPLEEATTPDSEAASRAAASAAALGYWLVPATLNN